MVKNSIISCKLIKKSHKLRLSPKLAGSGGGGEVGFKNIIKMKKKTIKKQKKWSKIIKCTIV